MSEVKKGQVYIIKPESVRDYRLNKLTVKDVIEDSFTSEESDNAMSIVFLEDHYSLLSSSTICQIKDVGFKDYISNIVKRVSTLRDDPCLKNHYNYDSIVNSVSTAIRFEEFQKRMSVVTGFKDLKFSRRIDFYTFSNDRLKKIFFVTKDFKYSDLKNLFLDDQPIDTDEWVSCVHTLPSTCCPRIGLLDGEITSIKDLLWVFYDDYEIVVPVNK